jgi:hypothetical protein
MGDLRSKTHATGERNIVQSSTGDGALNAHFFPPFNSKESAVAEKSDH